MQASKLPSSRGVGTGTEPLAGQFGVAPGENWRGSGHTRVHVTPAASAFDPGTGGAGGGG